MPFKPVEQIKCATCDKSVYAAELKEAGGHKYHKGCFKCGKWNQCSISYKRCRPKVKYLRAKSERMSK